MLLFHFKLHIQKICFYETISYCCFCKKIPFLVSHLHWLYDVYRCPIKCTITNIIQKSPSLGAITNCEFPDHPLIKWLWFQSLVWWQKINSGRFYHLKITVDITIDYEVDNAYFTFSHYLTDSYQPVSKNYVSYPNLYVSFIRY